MFEFDLSLESLCYIFIAVCLGSLKEISLELLDYEYSVESDGGIGDICDLFGIINLYRGHFGIIITDRYYIGYF